MALLHAGLCVDINKSLIQQRLTQAGLLTWTLLAVTCSGFCFTIIHIQVIMSSKKAKRNHDESHLTPRCGVSGSLAPASLAARNAWYRCASSRTCSAHETHASASIQRGRTQQTEDTGAQVADQSQKSDQITVEHHAL